MQNNGKQTLSDMDEPSDRYAKTIASLLLHPSFKDEKLSERQISCHNASGGFAGDDFISV